MQTMHLFAGAGGGLLADLILGHRPIVAVEWDRHACAVLRERAGEGWFPGLQVHEGDVRLFDPSEYTGRMDCIHAGFPCQDISVAGKGDGIEGERSGLYTEVLRIARAVRPQYLFLENVAAITSRGLDRVLGDLTQLGYDAKWITLPASAVGAPHIRARWWCLATNTDSQRVRDTEGAKPGGNGETKSINHRSQENDSDSDSERCGKEGRLRPGEELRIGGVREDVADTECMRRWQSARDSKKEGQPLCPSEREESTLLVGSSGQDVADSSSSGREEQHAPDFAAKSGHSTGRIAQEWGESWWSVEPDVGRVVNGLASRVDRIKALGNGQVPLQAAVAWYILGGP